jgi:MSHA biogenesis protein MshI
VASDAAGLSAAVVQRPRDGRPRVSQHQAFSGTKAMAALAVWQRKHGLLRQPTNLLLGPADDYHILPIQAPNTAPEERAGAARWLVKDMIDFPAEEASVDCLLVPDTPGSTRTPQALAVAVRRAAVAQWVQRADEVRLPLQSIDIPELALRNLAALPPGDGLRALLHTGLHRTTLVMVWQGELCSYRRFDLGLGQWLAADADGRAALIERLGLDLQRTADAFERQFQAAALTQTWVTQEHPELALADELAPHVSLSLRRLQLDDWLDMAASDTPLLDPATGIDQLLAIGAALREDAAA